MPEHAFDPSAFVGSVKDTFTVRRVFGEAYERSGTLVIPVATVLGVSGLGSGGAEGPAGSGSDAVGSGHGGGGGLGVRAVPVGVYEVDGSGVHFHPTFDLNRAVLGGQILVAAVLVTALAARALRRR
ncbi:MAG: sporulation protein [Actinobacteria bacterium]|nr:sporulation protein [Actinomycetota bacterium]MCG2800923.1 hypothetical protein [Cellulomonas sp.]